ncbi:MAG: hypothetical protein ACXV9R_10370 [Methylobacter sp.]
MTKRIVGVDQADRSWLISGLPKRIDPKGVAYNVVSLGILLATMAILFAMSSAVSAQSPVCYEIDHEQAEFIISDDMQEYLALYGRNQDYRLEDME